MPAVGRVRSAIAVAAVLMAVACGSGDDSSGADPTATEPTSVQAAADSFLERYVMDSGAVVRLDQGGDVVSEGQAYGMLIAEVAGRTDLVPTIWGWTSDHLRRPDGLLAFHASADGDVIDDSAATDADALAAFALLRYDGPQAAALHADGRGLAAAVLEHETVADASGSLVPVAGDWATSSPAVVNPSYWMPGVFDDLARLTGDDRWSELSSTTVALVDAATSGGSSLPPDWGRLDGTSLEPTPAPDGSVGVQYGLDAQRVPMWFASGCSTQAHDLAAAWWDLLASPSSSGAMALSLDGSVVNGTANPVPLLAAAAAARAAGDDGDAASLTKHAVELAQASPTYYGDAWAVLAQALADGSLVDCDSG
jgi:endoglucanase